VRPGDRSPLTSPPPRSERPPAAGCTYYLHVPGAALSRPGPGGYPLLVVVHDTTRNAAACRYAFAKFADSRGCLVLAPLFPETATQPADPDNYKFIAARQFRFDQILLDMVAEVARTYPVVTDRFLLHGFSGGAQFAHRFLYLHPERVAAVSIAAPGRVTPLDFSQPWWGGVADVPTLFGRPVDLAAIREAPVQILVGDHDTGPVEPGNPVGATNATGQDRPERARFLHASLSGHGVNSRLDIVPGARHEHTPLLSFAQNFLAAAPVFG
jgi:poly(3-hydroxybutyrate) depolymerase